MSLAEVAQVMVNTDSYVVQVDSTTGEPLGWIDALRLLRALTESTRGEVVARDIYVPIEPGEVINEADMSGEKLGDWYISRRRLLPWFFSQKSGTGGVLLLNEVISELLGLKEEETRRRKMVEKTYQDITEQLPVGLAICDGQGNIVLANGLARELINELGITCKNLLDPTGKGSSTAQVLEVKGGRYFNVTIHRLEAEQLAFLLLFTDVTAEYKLREEAEMALAVMLPDQRITSRLQSVVEYTDDYDPETGKIRITGVISQGTYRHVINFLRLLTERSTFPIQS